MMGGCDGRSVVVGFGSSATDLERLQLSSLSRHPDVVVPRLPALEAMTLFGTKLSR